MSVVVLKTLVLLDSPSIFILDSEHVTLRQIHVISARTYLSMKRLIEQIISIYGSDTESSFILGLESLTITKE